MTPRRRASRTRSPLRKDSLFAAAAAVFAARGYGGTKIADVAKAAGISQGLLYRYFPSKEALFVELIRRSFEQMNEAARGLEAMPGPAAQKIRYALERLVADIASSENLPTRVLLIAQASLSAAVPAKARRIMRSESGKPYEAIARILAEGQKQGGILPGDPTALSTLFWTTVKGLALHRVAKGRAFEAPPAELLYRLFLVTPAPAEPAISPL